MGRSLTQIIDMVQYLPVADCKSLACQVGRTEELFQDLWFPPPRVWVQQKLSKENWSPLQYHLVWVLIGPAWTCSGRLEKTAVQWRG